MEVYELYTTTEWKGVLNISKKQMYWIRIALEKCPKCHNETIRVLMVIRAEWIGGERLKCTTQDCKQRGVVRVKGKQIKFRYFTRRRRPKRKRIVTNK